METTMQVFLETMLRPRRDGQHLTRFDGGQITRQRTYPYIPTTLMGLMGLMGLTYSQRAKRGNAWSPHRVYALGIWTPLNPANPSKPLGRNGSALTGGVALMGYNPKFNPDPVEGRALVGLSGVAALAGSGQQQRRPPPPGPPPGDRQAHRPRPKATTIHS